LVKYYIEESCTPVLLKKGHGSTMKEIGGGCWMPQHGGSELSFLWQHTVATLDVMEI